MDCRKLSPTSCKSALNEADSEEEPKERPIFHICVASANSYMVRRQKNEGTPPAKVFVFWLNANDPRMFVRNGELIKPYDIVEFGFERVELCPELDHDRACYKEVARKDLDPADCVPIQFFNLENIRMR